MKYQRNLLFPGVLVLLGGCVAITTYVSPLASGTVTETASHKPIAGAIITVKDRPSSFARTNADGAFSLVPAKEVAHVIPLGPYDAISPGGTLIISADGYVPQQVTVHGGANSLHIALEVVR